MRKIGEFTPNILSGKSVESESRLKEKNEYGVLKVSAVTYGVFKPEEHKAIVNGYVPDKKITPNKGDILFSRANTKELVAATCIVDKDYPDLFLPDKLWKVNIDRAIVNEWFFKYVLSQQSYRNKLSEKSTGTSGSMFNISKEKLIDFNFPIPPLSLQQQFARIVAQAEQLPKSKGRVRGSWRICFRVCCRGILDKRIYNLILNLDVYHLCLSRPIDFPLIK
jgi:type I restriction enzyme S subunit